LLYAWANLDNNPPICASPVAEMTGMWHHAQPLAEIGSGELFAQSNLEPQSSWSPPPKQPRLQAWATMPSLFSNFICK
jgi:hypothetical protein